MFSIKEQTITDANTGVQVAFGRHDAAPAQPVADGEDAPPIVAQPSQWMRITAGGKVSTVFFTPDGDIRNIQAHPPLPGPGNDPDTDEAQPWAPEPLVDRGPATYKSPMVDEDFKPPNGSVPPVATPPIEG